MKKREANTIQDYAQPILQGILLGGLYAVIGVGMSMIFGIMRLTNLAHGDLMILASYSSFVAITLLGIHPLISLVIVVPLMFVVGFVVQNYLLNRVLGKGMEPPLLVTFGLSIILQNALLWRFTHDGKTLTSELATMSIPVTDYLSIPVIYLLDFVIGALIILGLSQFFQRTYLGRAIRAASDDEEVAKLMGISTRRIYGYAMGIDRRHGQHGRHAGGRHNLGPGSADWRPDIRDWHSTAGGLPYSAVRAGGEATGDLRAGIVRVRSSMIERGYLR